MRIRTRYARKSTTTPAAPVDNESRSGVPAEPPGDVIRTRYGDVEHIVYTVAPDDPAWRVDRDPSQVAPGGAAEQEASKARQPLPESAAPAEPEYDRYGNRIHRDPPGTWTIRFDTGGVDVSNQRGTSASMADYDPLQWGRDG